MLDGLFKSFNRLFDRMDSIFDRDEVERALKMPPPPPPTHVAEVPFLAMVRGGPVRYTLKTPSGSWPIDVPIPAGVQDGAVIRLDLPGGPIGLQVKVMRHEFLRRAGKDLLMNLPVTALEAVRGGPIEVPTPTGAVTVKLKRNCQNGLTLRLKGQGIAPPNDEPGDLLLTLDVRLPERSTAEHVRVLEELQGQANVRAGLVL